ncbi:uncharacterized protein ARMOST_15273 [Armillaria ostoyae]|uniref:DUF659 domain-containing protein n=1 Tax=Armillaria ostoyae TaxID=47428 RepID=A0A284RSX8_ARMOS|nr:uncharacterized protein ARMOST_15273 [Armillaria ostoyae]
MAPSVSSISALVQQLARLCSKIPPKALTEALPDDYIYHVITNVVGEDTFSTFNRRFDILYAEHLRDENGRLPNLRRGKYGLDAVISYLQSVPWPEVPLDPVEPKLQRLITEVVSVLKLYAESLKQQSTGSNFQPVPGNVSQYLSTNTNPATPAGQAVLPPAPTACSTATPLLPASPPTHSIESDTPTGLASNSTETGLADSNVSTNTEGKKNKPKKKGKGRGKDPITQFYNPDAFASDDEDPSYRLRRRNVSESPVKSYSLAEDGLEEISNASDNDDYAPNLAETSSKSKRKRVVLVSDSENHAQNDEVMYTARKKTKTKAGVKKAKTKDTSKKADTTPQPPPQLRAIEITDDEDDEEDMQQSRGPKNQSRLHFSEPRPVVIDDIRDAAIKRTVKGKDIQFDRDETRKPALGNLSTHLRNNHRNIPPPNTGTVTSAATSDGAKIMEEFLRNGELNATHEPTQEGFNKVFAAWCLQMNLPFTLGESEGADRVFRYIKSRFSLPSDMTIRNKLERIHNDLSAHVKEEIRNVKSRIATSTDTWTTRSMMFSFAGTVATWIMEDWRLVERVIDFHPIEEKEHAGMYAAVAFAKSTSQFGVLEKISYLRKNVSLLADDNFHRYLLTVSMDNASVNEMLATTLATLMLQHYRLKFVPENGYIHCLDHVVSLVVQALMNALEEAEDPNVLDYHGPNKKYPSHYSEDDDEALRELEAEIEREMDEDELLRTSSNIENEDNDELLEAILSDVDEWSPVKKLRLIVTKICSSPQRRRTFRMIAKDIYKDQRAPSGCKIAVLMAI